MKDVTIKGSCSVCNKPVFHNQPRNKNQDGSYVYAECEGVDSDIGPMNVTGRWSSMLPGQIQQLQNFGQHEVQPRFVKGMCTLWNTEVFNDQPRQKNHQGSYVDVQCLGV